MSAATNNLFFHCLFIHLCVTGIKNIYPVHITASNIPVTFPILKIPATKNGIKNHKNTIPPIIRPMIRTMGLLYSFQLPQLLLYTIYKKDFCKSRVSAATQIPCETFFYLINRKFLFQYVKLLIKRLFSYSFVFLNE